MMPAWRCAALAVLAVLALLSTGQVRAQDCLHPTIKVGPSGLCEIRSPAPKGQEDPLKGNCALMSGTYEPDSGDGFSTCKFPPRGAAVAPVAPGTITPQTPPPAAQTPPPQQPPQQAAPPPAPVPEHQQTATERERVLARAKEIHKRADELFVSRRFQAASMAYMDAWNYYLAAREPEMAAAMHKQRHRSDCWAITRLPLQQGGPFIQIDQFENVITRQCGEVAPDLVKALVQGVIPVVLQRSETCKGTLEAASCFTVKKVGNDYTVTPNPQCEDTTFLVSYGVFDAAGVCRRETIDVIGRQHPGMTKTSSVVLKSARDPVLLEARTVVPRDFPDTKDCFVSRQSALQRVAACTPAR
jgi:hypothetical protein